MKALIYKGFDGFFGGIVVIFDSLKSGEMLDFVGFCRSAYRTRNGGLGVDGTHSLDFKNRNDS